MSYELACILSFLDVILIAAVTSVKWYRCRRFSTVFGAFVLVFILIPQLTFCLAVIKALKEPFPWDIPFDIPIAFLLIYPGILFVGCMVRLCYEIKLHYTTITRSSIISAINELECGLMFYTEDGKIILKNRTMEKVGMYLTEGYIYNGNRFWQKIISFDKSEHCKRIDFTQWPAFFFDTGQVWSFEKNILKDADRTCYEIVARNVTNLYNKRSSLAAENGKLKRLNYQLTQMLKNISEIGNEEELLNYKVRIHDQLGNAILRARKSLRDENSSKESVDEILHVWENTIRAFSQNASEVSSDLAGLEELFKLAATLGVELYIDGKYPADNPLAIRALRECMYNSIRHAYANKVYAESYLAADGYHVKIYDDGKFGGTSVNEGGGLSSLRRSVEGLGGVMNVGVGEGVEVNILFPVKRKD